MKKIELRRYLGHINLNWLFFDGFKFIAAAFNEFFRKNKTYYFEMDEERCLLSHVCQSCAFTTGSRPPPIIVAKDKLFLHKNQQYNAIANDALHIRHNRDSNRCRWKIVRNSTQITAPFRFKPTVEHQGYYKHADTNQQSIARSLGRMTCVTHLVRYEPVHEGELRSFQPHVYRQKRKSFALQNKIASHNSSVTSQGVRVDHQPTVSSSPSTAAT